MLLGGEATQPVGGATWPASEVTGPQAGPDCCRVYFLNFLKKSLFFIFLFFIFFNCNFLL